MGRQGSYLLLQVVDHWAHSGGCSLFGFFDVAVVVGYIQDSMQRECGNVGLGTDECFFWLLQVS